MNKWDAIAWAALGVVFLGGPAASVLLPPAPVEEKPLPRRPDTLTESSVLDYAVAYESVHLNNQLIRERGGPSGIESLITCDSPGWSLRVLMADAWIEKRAGDQFYVTLRCPVDLESKGPEQSGSGTIGKWTMYAITPNSTSRVVLGGSIEHVPNRTVNFDDKSHVVAVTATMVGGAGREPILQRIYEVDGSSYETIRARAPASGTYRVHVRVDGGSARSYSVTVERGENLLYRIGIYVSSNGTPVIDARTETGRESDREWI